MTKTIDFPMVDARPFKPLEDRGASSRPQSTATAMGSATIRAQAVGPAGAILQPATARPASMASSHTNTRTAQGPTEAVSSLIPPIEPKPYRYVNHDEGNSQPCHIASTFNDPKACAP